jgi:predicted transposase/invertase (TIGR01784 family)
MIGDKSVTFDVRAVLQGRTRVDVEAQIRDQHNMERRSLFYWGREFVKTLKSGGKYQDIPDVMAVDIVGFDFPHSRKYHTCFHLREDCEPELILTNSLEIHFINMVQYYRSFGSELKKGKILLSDLVRDEPLIPWLVWFDKKTSPKLLEEAIEMNSAIQAADERLVYLSGDEDAIRLYEMRFKAECDQASEVAYSFEKGEAKGTLKIARKMKKAGRPFSEIAEFTGLPPETIERL